MADNNAATTPWDVHYLCGTLHRMNKDKPIRSGHEPKLVSVYLRLSCDLVFADASPSRWRMRSRTKTSTVPVTNAEWRRLETRWLHLFRGVSQVGSATREQSGGYMSRAFYVTGRLERTHTNPDEPMPDTLETMVFIATDVEQRDRWIKCIGVAVDPLEKPSLSTSDTDLRQAILASMSSRASTTLSNPAADVVGQTSAIVNDDVESSSGSEKLISKIADEMIRGAEAMDDTRKIFGIIVSSITKAADVVDKVFIGQPFVGAAVHVVTMTVKAGAIIAEVSQMGTNLKSLREEYHKISQRILCEMLAGLGGSPWGDEYFEKLKEVLLSVEDMTRRIERACVAGTVGKIGLRDSVNELEKRITEINKRLEMVESFGHIKLMCEENKISEENSVVLKDIQSVVRRLETPATPTSLRKAKSGVAIELETLRALGKRTPPEVSPTYVQGMDIPERVEYKVKQELLSVWDSQRPTAPRVALLGIGGSGKSTACMAVAADEDVLKHYGNRITWLQFNDTASAETLHEAVMTIVAVICGAEIAGHLSGLDDSDFISIAREVVASEPRKSGENMLFILDDIWDVTHLQTLMDLLPNRASVVLTTRLPKVADAMGGAEQFDVERLPGCAARELLARRMGRSRSDSSNREWFTETEEDEFVKSIMQETDQLPLAVDIVGCIVKSRDDAWADVLRQLQKLSVANDRIVYPTGTENPRKMHRSIRTALGISVEFLDSDSLVESFCRLGVLPSNETVVNSALCILWGEKVLDGGQSQLPEEYDEEEGKPCSKDDDSSMEVRKDEVAFRELDNAGVDKKITELRDIGLVNLSLESGRVRGIWVHSTVRAFALELLRDRCKERETHALLVDGYGARHGFKGTSEAGLPWYPVWKLYDDGYAHQNIARHVEKSWNAAVASYFRDPEWEDVRNRKFPGAAYQADVEHACRTLEAYLNSWNGKQDGDKVRRAWMYHCLGVLVDSRAGDPSSNVDNAIRCYEEALQVSTRESYPRNWALLKMDLGNAYREKQKGNREENIERSIQCYEEALQVFTRESSYPNDWALTKMSLGIVFRKRQKGEREENVERSIQCYEEALQVYIRESFPKNWALTKLNLGNAFRDKLKGDLEDNIDRSIKCYEDALQVLNRESYPKFWARTKMNLGNAFRQKQRGDREENIEKSVQCYEEALKVFTHESHPNYWAVTRKGLAIALKEKQSLAPTRCSEE